MKVKFTMNHGFGWSGCMREKSSCGALARHPPSPGIFSRLARWCLGFQNLGFLAMRPLSMYIIKGASRIS
jgi:hypothetical protein